MAKQTFYPDWELDEMGVTPEDRENLKASEICIKYDLDVNPKYSDYGRRELRKYAYLLDKPGAINHEAIEREEAERKAESKKGSNGCLSVLLGIIIALIIYWIIG